jgi:hypothetical protein
MIRQIAGKDSKEEKHIYIPYGTYDLFNVKYYVIFDESINDLLNYSKNNVFTTYEEAENTLLSLNNENYQIKEIDNPWVSPLVSYSNFKFEEISLNNEVTLKLINENGESYNNGTITLVSDNDKLRFTATNEPRTSTFNNDINGYNIDFNNNVNHSEEVSIFNDNGDYIGSFVADYEINTYEVRVENLEHNASTYSLRNNSNTEEMANITKKEYEALLSRVNQMAEIIGKLKK